MPRKRRSRKPYPTQRYGQAHRAMRARLAPAVAAGTIRCARCNELIEPGSEWHLDHRDDGQPGWLGPSHKACNLRGGWEAMVKGNGNDREFSEAPDRWSRRWRDDPQVGTEVFLGGGLVEVHVGRGVWQTVSA